MAPTTGQFLILGTTPRLLSHRNTYLYQYQELTRFRLADITGSVAQVALPAVSGVIGVFAKLYEINQQVPEIQMDMLNYATALKYGDSTQITSTALDLAFVLADLTCCPVDVAPLIYLRLDPY